MEAIESVLMSAAENVSDVELDGRAYEASNLVRCIIDWPCGLEWDDGLKIVGDGWEDWEWFRKGFLKPNQEQVIDIIQQANESERLRKHFEQKLIFEGE